MSEKQWELVIPPNNHQAGVRRLRVPDGWIYQVQTGITHHITPGLPIWGAPVFVPRSLP